MNSEAGRKDVVECYCCCGKPSVVFDSWFAYYPCASHKHLTPNEYKQLCEGTLESLDE